MWCRRGQSGNDIEATKHNARACGVEDRVELNTGNITTLPYHDAQFDLVVSSLAIHNLRAREDRREPSAQAVRVLEPGGKIIIADISHTEEYADWLTEAGMESVTLQDLGVRGWWGWTSAAHERCDGEPARSAGRRRLALQPVWRCRRPCYRIIF